MTCKESIKWLENLKSDLDKSQFSELWHYEQALDETIELLQSERLVELPCKVGDMVYYLDDIVDNLCTDCENYYESGICNYPICKKTLYGFRPAKCIKIIEIVANKDFILEYYDKFGEKIFLTKEEAEVKLKELNNDQM